MDLIERYFRRDFLKTRFCVKKDDKYYEVFIMKKKRSVKFAMFIGDECMEYNVKGRHYGVVVFLERLMKKPFPEVIFEGLKIKRDISESSIILSIYY